MRQSVMALRVLVGVAVCACAAQAAERVKANVVTNLNVGASWVGGATPGVNDYGKWTSTVTDPAGLQLGGDMSVQGFVVANPAGPVGIGGTNTLTLGFVGLNLNAATVNMSVTNQRVHLLDYVTPYWVVPAGLTLTVSPAQLTRGAGAGLGVIGAGTVLSSALTNDATGLVGPWAWYGTNLTTRFAAVSGGAVQGYAAGTAAATAAAVTDTTGTQNYDLGVAGTLGAGASFHTLRYTGAAGTLAGNFAADGLLNVSSSGGLTLSGNVAAGANKELVLVSPSTSRSLTLSGTVADSASGASGVTLTGGGMAYLTGSNTYSGVTSVGSGILYINKANSLGATAGNTVIYVNGSSVTGGAMQVAGSITLAEPITFVGSGDGAPWNSALYVPGGGGTNTIVGPITIAAVGVRISCSGNGTGLNLNGPITRTSSGNTLIIGAGGAGGFVNINGPINNNGGALTTHNGPGLVRLYSMTNNIGTLNVQTYHTVQLNVSQAFVTGCALQVGGGNTTAGDQARGIFDMNGFSEVFNDFRGEGAPSESPTVRVVTNSSPTLSWFTIGSANGGGTYNGHIDGNIALVKNGTGTSTLCGPNRYTGGTTVNGGVLVLSNAVNHAALAVNGGTFRFPPALAVSGCLSGTGGTIDTLASGSALSVNQATNSTFAGAITGAGSLTKSGAGSLALSGANTYSGGTTVSGGALVFGKLAAKPPSGSVTVAAGAALGLGVGTNTSTYFSAADVDSLWAGALPGVALDAASRVAVDTTAGDYTYATSQSSRGLVKTGANTLTLTGANSYPGGTSIQQGVLSIANTGALPGWNVPGAFDVWRDATLAVQNAVVDADVAAILATGNFASGACIGFDTAAGNRTYADAVSNTAAGALGLYKIGVNTLTLTNANTYDGNTVVNGGIVVVRNNSALGSTNGYTLVNRVGGTAPLYTDSTGQLQLDGSGGALTLDENFILNGAEQYGYLGALRSLSGNNTLNGWIKVGAGGARIGNNSGTFTLNGPITREWPSYNPMLVLNPSGMLIVSNRIELGTGGVNFHSGGTVWLCSTGNTWTGYSQIQYGCIVRLGADHALPTGIKLTLGNPGTPPGNGTLDLYGFDQTVGGLIQNGTDPSFPNNLIRNSQAGDPSTLTVSQAAGVSDFFSGRLRENLSLVKAGAANSVLTLNGTNSFSGSTLVTGGTLTLSPTGTLGVACTNIAVSAGTLSVQNSDALSDDATVSLAAGGAAKLSLAAGVTEVVSFLFIDGDLQRPGTYGSADSGATFKDSTTFSGTGVLRVLHGKSIGTTFTVK